MKFELYIKALKHLINEIDVAFDNIDKEIISKLNKYTVKLEKDESFCGEQTQLFLTALKPYESKLCLKKMKTRELEFLNGLVLFNDLLQLKWFEKENKNTKMTLVNFLNTMYVSGDVCLNGIDDVIEKLEMEKLEMEKLEIEKRNVQMKQKNPMEDMLSSLMGNSSIMSMAAELTHDLQNKKLDPLKIMSSLMSGKPDEELQGIINNITTKLEKKIESGEINKNELERQTTELMKNVEQSDVVNGLLSPDTLNKLMKEM